MEYHIIVIQEYVIQEEEEGRRRLNRKVLGLTMDPQQISKDQGE